MITGMNTDLSGALRLTENSWKHLIKDFNMPFPFICKEQAVEAYTCMLYTGSTNYDMAIRIVNLVAKHPSQDTFFSEVNHAMYGMIDHILGSVGYADEGKNAGCFNKCNIQEKFPLPAIQYPGGDIYNHENVGKHFISVDLKNAAFQMFQLWDRIYKGAGLGILPDDVDCYRDFVASKTNDAAVVEYIANCKSLRQVILGKTNPKRLMHMEKWVMYSIARQIREASGIQPIKVNNDELIYEASEDLEKYLLSWDHTIKVDMDGTVSLPVNVGMEEFVLEEGNMEQRIACMPVTGQTRFFIKATRDILTGYKSNVFKCLPKDVELVMMTCLIGDEELQHRVEALPILNGKMVVFMNNDDTNCWRLNITR